MRTVLLSNYPESELRTERARRDDEYKTKLAERDVKTVELVVRYDTALRERACEIATLERDARRLRSNGRPLRALRTWVDPRRVRNSPPPDPPSPPPPLRPPEPTTRELTLAAGIDGEQKAAAELDSMLDDDWIYLRGYRNNRGEIDGLLLGPSGLFAIESKHRAVKAHCRCDDWWGERLDKWGNPHDPRWLVDGRGRSPSKQLNDAAEALEHFLDRRRQTITIFRIVLLTHPRAACGTFESPTVDLITTATADIVALTEAEPSALSPSRRLRLKKLIAHDHRFHEQRTQRRRADVPKNTCQRSG
jgi:hypothetical protein